MDNLLCAVAILIAAVLITFAVCAVLGIRLGSRKETPEE